MRSVEQDSLVVLQPVYDWVALQAAINYVAVDGSVVPPDLSDLSAENRAEILFGDPQRRQMIERKITHTNDIAHATAKIMEKMNWVIEGENIPWNTTMAFLIAMIHDVSRFEEAALNGIANVGNNDYDHGQEGAKKFKKAITDGGFLHEYWSELEDLGCNAEVVYEAVLHHNPKEYQGNNPYVKLIRDADKFANVYAFDNFCKSIEGNDSLIENGISLEVLQEFQQTKSVSIGHVKTRADHLLLTYSWFFDLNFQATRNLWIENNFGEKLLDKMREWQIDEETIQAIKAVDQENSTEPC